MIIKSSHHLPNVSNYTISWTAMQISSKDENLVLSNEYSDIHTGIHRDVFFMYNRYLAPSNCENHRHGSVSGCRNRIFSVIDNCSASGQLLIDSFQFSVLFLSLLFFRDGEKKKCPTGKISKTCQLCCVEKRRKRFVKISMILWNLRILK